MSERQHKRSPSEPDPFAGDADYWAALELTPQQHANLRNAGTILNGTMPAKPNKWNANPHNVYHYSPSAPDEDAHDAAASAHAPAGTIAPQIVELKDVPDPLLPPEVAGTALQAMLQHPRPE